MSGLRARSIRTLIVAAMKGAVLDKRAGTDDRMQWLNEPRRPAAARERTFRVITAAQPSKGAANTCDDYVVEFTLEIYYALTAEADDRCNEDHERFWPSLLRLANGDPMLDVIVAPLGVEETAANYIARVSVIAHYRLDSTLFA